MPPLPTRRLPADFEQQSGLILTWPSETQDWADLLAVEHSLLSIAVIASCEQRVIIVVPRAALSLSLILAVQANGGLASNIACVNLPSNDIWARDHGPITIIDNDQARLQDFGFDGWGGKYPAEQDNLLTARIHRRGLLKSAQLDTHGWILEGGAIESDGAGTILSTRHWWHKRHPELDDEGISQKLNEHLGAVRVLLLDVEPLLGDDTDGHIDTLARFTSPETIVYQGCQDAGHPQFENLQNMADQLAKLKQADGTAYRLFELPMPGDYKNAEGHLLPAAYANFILLNNRVIIPTFDDPADEIACNMLKEAMPGRTFHTVNALPLIEQHGSLHCVCMQLPAALELPS